MPSRSAELSWHARPTLQSDLEIPLAKTKNADLHSEDSSQTIDCMSPSAAARTMRFQFQAVHRSIDHLPISELPDFCIITGRNGSGKTHFLEALSQGRISIDNVSQNLIRYYTWQNFSPRDNSVGGRVVSQRHNQWVAFQTLLNQHSERPTVRRVRGRSPKELVALWRSDAAQRPSIDQELRSQFQLIQQQMQPAVRKLLEEFEKDTGYPALCITEEAFYERFPLIIAETDLFQASVAELFAAYITALEENDVAEIRARRSGKDSFLSQDRFRQKFGPPPWEVVNKALVQARLDYRIVQPADDPGRAVSAILRKPSIDADLLFSSLSSGEKILISLALSMFLLQDKRQPVTIPEVLLFDEVDAFLHPEMIGSLLSIIDVLVNEYGRKVILVTHSPATVALAPDGSTFVMDDRSRNIRSASIDEGVAALTVGVPTLSIKLENRRQVFVESENDVRMWELCYVHAKSRLRRDISLSFIPSGAPAHAGCARVRDVVRALRENGNTTVAGLIDWDGVNDREDGLFINGFGRRYSIENYLLDPVLVGALLLRDKVIAKSDLGLSADETYIDLRAFNSERLQTIAEEILRRVDSFDGDRIACSYANGCSVNLPSSFLSMKGHALEAMIRTAFPALCRYKAELALKTEILSKVIDDLEGLLPNDLIETLSCIQAFGLSKAEHELATASA